MVLSLLEYCDAIYVTAISIWVCGCCTVCRSFSELQLCCHLSQVVSLHVVQWCLGRRRWVLWRVVSVLCSELPDPSPSGGSAELGAGLGSGFSLLLLALCCLCCLRCPFCPINKMRKRRSQGRRGCKLTPSPWIWAGLCTIHRKLTSCSKHMSCTIQKVIFWEIH